MLDIENVVFTNSQKEKYLYKLKKLEAKKRRVIRQLEELQNLCNHDLVLYFGEENAPINTDAYAICPCCGKTYSFSLLNPDSNEDLKKENIISVIGYLERRLDRKINLNKLNINTLVSRAQNKLLSIVELDPEISRNDLKEEVLNDLLALMLENEIEDLNNFSRIRK